MDTKTIATTLNNNAQPEARWLRLPASGKICPVSGLKRSSMLNLVQRSKGRIKAAHLREPGARRGSWLIFWPSLHGYLFEQAESTTQGLGEEELAALPTGEDE